VIDVQGITLSPPGNPITYIQGIGPADGGARDSDGKHGVRHTTGIVMEKSEVNGDNLVGMLSSEPGGRAGETR